MRHSVLGFNQEKVMQTNLDLTDLVLLQYIINANGNPEMKHTIKDDISYVWLSHSKIQEDLPILKITEGTLRNRLTNLKKDGWIISETVKLHTGTNTYYSVSLSCMSLINDVQNKTEIARHAEMTCARHAEMTSDNKLKDNKLNSNFTNVKLEQSSTSPKTPHRRLISDLPESHSNKNKDTVSEEKPKKGLYQSCADMISEFAGENIKLKDKLMEFLGVRLEIKSKPFGTKTFKSYLNKLNELSVDVTEQIKIIQQSIDRQYPSFYEVKKYNNYNGVDKFGELGQVHSVRSKESNRSNVYF